MNKIPPLRIAVVIGILVILTAVYLFARSGRKPTPPPAVKLTVWGTEPYDIATKLTDGYSAVRPNVTITYREIPEDQYDAVLLEALAAGAGPDVFFIKNNALPREISKLVAANSPQITPAIIASLFPEAVANDVILNGKIYALPVNFDTLVLMGNRDLLDQAGLVTLPATWSDILADISKFQIKDATGNITRSAIPLGDSSRSVRYAPDILSLLMLQNGTTMLDKNRGKAIFDGTVGTTTPGLAALNFYLQFTNGASPYHTWDTALGNSENAFASGKSAFLLGYRSDLPAIQQKSPFLKVVVGSAPQPRTDFAVNLAHYDTLAVSKQTKQSAWAWDFVFLSSTTSAIQKDYLSAGSHTPALRSALSEIAKTPDGEPIARAALTAKTWYEPDDRAVSAILDELILSVRSGERAPMDALQYAADRVNELLNTNH